MMPQQDKPFERAVPYNKLQDIEGYISIHDGKENWVMKVNLTILKVTKVEGHQSPDNRPQFNFASNNSPILLTNEEYKTMTGRDVQP